MGLELVEFTLAVEDAFGIFIPDTEAAAIITPGQLVEYVEMRIGKGVSLKCLEQRAFYKLRRAGMQVLSCPREAFKPDNSWVKLLHPKQHNRQWGLLKSAAGISPWPRLKPLLSFGPTTQTVGQTARTVAATAAASLLRSNEGFNRIDIEKIIQGLMREQLGITKFEWSDRFLQDLGLD
jgi:hypothetical protein